ncbi:MAG: sigma 54-interacting transcriptional regulator [Flavisolibacter sp.]|nr:sigma 54-interacting transcriptional regulator [Flavisolibacter sp.]
MEGRFFDLLAKPHFCNQSDAVTTKLQHQKSKIEFLRDNYLVVDATEPIGSHTGTKVDIRIIVATNKNLEQEAGEGRFQLDLYYRCMCSLFFFLH